MENKKRILKSTLSLVFVNPRHEPRHDAPMTNLKTLKEENPTWIRSLYAHVVARSSEPLLSVHTPWRCMLELNKSPDGNLSNCQPVMCSEFGHHSAKGFDLADFPALWGLRRWDKAPGSAHAKYSPTQAAIVGGTENKDGMNPGILESTSEDQTCMILLWLSDRKS